MKYMGFDQPIVLAVMAGICVVGAAAFLLRVAVERDRLMSRYSTIKSMMVYEEELKLRHQKEQDAVAGEAEFISADADL